MDLANLLLALLIFLTATAVCVTLFKRLGLGSVVGFIIAGVIIGPHTPGPVVSEQVTALQNISELGVVLFLFAVGLEMQPKQVWAMRRQLFGLGGGQVLLTAVALGLILYYGLDVHWQTATIVSLGLAMSSTAVVMTILADRGELSSTYGTNSFSILMAQDLSIVPVMALIPVLAHVAGQQTGSPLWVKSLLAVAVLAGIFLAGRRILPGILAWTARDRNDEAFGITLFLGIVAAAWAVDLAGISMTLGAFLLGMLLSASDYRYQIASVIEPFKGTLMGLFFIAVGMSIDVELLIADWQNVLLIVVAVLVIKTAVLVALCRAFRVDWQASVRTGFALSQVGEFAFVLFSASSAAGLVTRQGISLGFAVISVSMILTPLMIRLGDRIACRIRQKQIVDHSEPARGMKDHLVVVGLDEIGFTIALMAEKCTIPYVAFDRDDSKVHRGRQAGMNAHYGDILYGAVQQGAGISRARAVFISTTDPGRLKAIALYLRQRYPVLDIYARVQSLDEQAYLRSMGIKHASTIFLESTLVRGESLLKEMGVTEEQAHTLVENLRKNDYELIKAAFSNVR